MLKYGITNQAKIKHHSAEEIQFEAIADQTGITSDGVLITPEVLKSSARWMLGRPVTMGPVGGPAGSSSAVGQVDEVKVWPTGQMYVTGTLFPQKLSSEQLQGLKRADQPLQAKAGYFLMTMPEAGTWQGKNYREKATALQYDHLSLVLPQVKGHSAPTQRDRLLEIERSWEARLGRRC